MADIPGINSSFNSSRDKVSVLFKDKETKSSRPQSEKKFDFEQLRNSSEEFAKQLEALAPKQKFDPKQRQNAQGRQRGGDSGFRFVGESSRQRRGDSSFKFIGDSSRQRKSATQRIVDNILNREFEKKLKPVGDRLIPIEPQLENVIFNEKFLRIAEKAENYVADVIKSRGEFVNLKVSQIFSNATELPEGGEKADKVLDPNSAKFLEKNKDLVEIVNENSSLLSNFISDDVRSEDDAKQLVVNFVYDKLDTTREITKDFLDENFLLTKFVASDFGNITEILNNDTRAETAFTAEPSFGLELLEKQIVSSVASLFPTSETITSTFLANNPFAAVNLLGKPQKVKALKIENGNNRLKKIVVDDIVSESKDKIKIKDKDKDKNKDKDKKIKIKKVKSSDKTLVSNISSLNVSFRSETVNFAFNQINNKAVLNRSFLNANPRFTLAVAGDFLTNKNRDNTLAQFLNEDKELTRITKKPPDVDKIFASFHAEIAVRKLPEDSALDREFLSANVNIAFMVNQSPEFAKALEKDNERIEKFVDLNRGGTGERELTKEEVLTSLGESFDAFLDVFGAPANGDTGESVDLTG